jgi:hypothetical protein
MIWRCFDEMIWRPWAALISTLEILGNRLPTKLKVDASVSRALHALGRSVPTRPWPTKCEIANRTDSKRSERYVNASRLRPW